MYRGLRGRDTALVDRYYYDFNDQAAGRTADRDREGS
jgi:hypothetical protein